MTTPTITIRLPDVVRTALEAQADTAGVPLRTYIVTTLAQAVGSTTTTGTVTLPPGRMNVPGPIKIDNVKVTGADPTTTPQTTGMTVPSPAPKPEEAPVVKLMHPAQESDLRKDLAASSTKKEKGILPTPDDRDPNDERNRRHLSPAAMPVRTQPRPGYEIAEADCAHPRTQLKVMTYMTTCNACGRRMR